MARMWRALRRIGGVVMVGVGMGGMLLATSTRITVWADPCHVWRDAVTHSPEKPRPWVHVGAQCGRDDEAVAVAAFRRAVALSDHSDRRRVEGPMRVGHVARLNWAIVVANRGQYADALALTAEIQPRAEGRASPVNRMESQWRDEQRHGGSSQGF